MVDEGKSRRCPRERDRVLNAELLDSSLEVLAVGAIASDKEREWSDTLSRAAAQRIEKVLVPLLPIKARWDEYRELVSVSS